MINMRVRSSSINVLLVCFVVISSVVGHGGDHNNKHNNPKKIKHKEMGLGGLKMNFYKESCPGLENIVEEITSSKVKADPTMAPKLLRLHYHDCFVRGCDASILIDPVNGNNSTEKNAIPNRSIAGYEVVDEIKKRLEQHHHCPNTVSCADITALAARDAVSSLYGETLWPVYTGRRDGRVSNASEASRDLPSGGSNFTTLHNLFARFGLNDFDLAALSGAHTIGVAHCGVISRRLYDFTGNGDTDPSLDPDYAAELKKKCPDPANPSTTVDLDRASALSFDSHYFMGLFKKQGLLLSDSALLTSPQTRGPAQMFRNFLFFKEAFAHSMVKMGSIGVLTGDDGEIRKNCRVINKI